MELQTAKRKFLRKCKTWGVYDRVAASSWRQKRLLILCYHSFSLEDEHLWRPVTFEPLSFLQERLQSLSESGASVLPLTEAVERLYAGALPPVSVCLTFDDGTYDFYKTVLPLLKKYGYPATLYMSTYYCEARRPVFPLMCSYLLWKARNRVLTADRSLGIERDIDLRDPGNREWAHRQILSATDSRTEAEFAQRLAARLEIDYRALLDKRILQLMTPEEAAEAARAGIDVQLHTHRHRTPEDHDLFIREIRDNRFRVERITGIPAVHFCYPSGVWRREFLPWLNEERVATATTCEPGLASIHSEKLLLPRLLDMSTLTSIEFEGWLAGVGSWLPRRASRRSENGAASRAQSSHRTP